jgi:hypothetical protein
MLSSGCCRNKTNKPNVLSMLAFTLFPFAVYLAVLAFFHSRRTPTVLGGDADFMLLAAGLLGAVTFGPGRLLIPLYVLTAWGILTWVFWFGFYFVLVLFITRYLTHRTVIYHCRREMMLPGLFAMSRYLDPSSDLRGNVLTLPGFGLQWTISEYCGGVVLCLTVSQWDKTKKDAFDRELKNLCRTLQVSYSVQDLWVCLLWTTLSIIAFAGSAWFLIQNFGWLGETFVDYWL